MVNRSVTLQPLVYKYAKCNPTKLGSLRTRAVNKLIYAYCFRLMHATAKFIVVLLFSFVGGVVVAVVQLLFLANLSAIINPLGKCQSIVSKRT